MVTVRTEILNMSDRWADKDRRGQFLVARQDRGRLWYYGTYEKHERAEQAALEIGNGIVLEVVE